MLTNILLFALWFFFPASIANSAPVIITKIPILKNVNFPLDFYLKLNGKRLIGPHKTLSGFTLGIMAGTTAAYLQKLLIEYDPALMLFIPEHYAETNIVLIGLLLSIGALTGNTLKSILKRQAGIKPGVSWFPYDEVDYIVGALIFTLPIIQLDLRVYFMILFIWFFMYPAALLMQGYLKIENNPKR
jgi:CDP-2,3-bis-(O-geranylgeranyl)-sn-glycerol synthase